MPSITLTVTPTEANRIQAAITAAGYPDVKSWIAATLAQTVQQFEQNQNTRTFAQGYTPVTPI